MYATSNFKRGLKVLFQGNPYEITEIQHYKPGKGASIVRTKMKNIITGLTIDPTFRVGDKLDRPDLEEKDVQFLYKNGDIYNFMDPKNYEQFEVDVIILKVSVNFIIENMIVSLLFFEGKVLSIELPNHVILRIIECDPVVRGDTVIGATKLARFITGHECQVPLFINRDENVKIDTRTGHYISRG